MSAGNRVAENVVEGSGRADIALAGPAASGNCFAGNEAAFTLPVGLEVFQSCDGLRLPWLFELAGSTEQLGRIAEVPKPGPQENMPVDAPVRPAVDVFAAARPDLESISGPDLPPDVTVHQTRGVTLFGVLFASAAGVFFGLYAYLLPFVLYAAWVGIALWDLARRDDVGKGKVIAWTAVILLIPFVGVIAYHLFSASPIRGGSASRTSSAASPPIW